ncbi:MAG: Flp pilus assembly complex ATPase component TadA, partial [Gemmatimonadetes bacterium]|nr:Flp pilus assembly complex ATPase component TadA [Gemmatimonadota bacterium]
EDPVEYVHRSKRCLVNQRSVHRHTESFAHALRAALREDPDVIVIGELRDLETISLALTAAETGHLVLATLHTDNAIRTINRVIGSYPSDAQGQIRTMLSESLRAVISQRLIARKDGKGRVPAIETLIVNKAVGNLIRENKTFQIQSILQTGAAQGMALLDAAIHAHVQSGVIARDEALRYCADPKNLAA